MATMPCMAVGCSQNYAFDYPSVPPSLATSQRRNVATNVDRLSLFFACFSAHILFSQHMIGESSKSVPKRRTRRQRLFDVPISYWQAEKPPEPKSFIVPAASTQEDENNPEPLPVSDHSVCATCGLSFTTFLQQRIHFKTDVHKYNAKRKVRGKPSVTEEQFEELDDLGSVGSLSGSEAESEEEQASPTVVARGKLAERLEFHNPVETDTYIVLYKASLPDTASLQSLKDRGSWAILMAGGGHFVAALWNVNGALVRHKTFHRYTTRRKQGGSQAAADEARGNASRIRSAGATLRRYGEQALQKEVHDLLKDWHNALSAAQCIYIRASQREKRDLFLGWQGSPLKKAQEEGRLRSIPIPTRRATLKEATRVYNELSTLTISSHSIAEEMAMTEKLQAVKTKQPSHPQNSTTVHQKPAAKGTDHLKKRDNAQKKYATEVSVPEPVPEVVLDEAVSSLLRMCLTDEREQMLATFEENPDSRSILFEKHYLCGDERFQQVDDPVGLVGVAAVCDSPELVEWLLDHGVSPSTGSSPYLVTKSKGVRTALRKYWGRQPDRYDYAAAGIPGPLSEEDLRAAAERERAKRKKEREKKKEKARERAEAAKPPEQRARELRAMAAEARMLGNRCAACRRSLEGITPFARLAYKYCSTECVAKHRAELSRKG